MFLGLLAFLCVCAMISLVVSSKYPMGLQLAVALVIIVLLIQLYPR